MTTEKLTDYDDLCDDIRALVRVSEDDFLLMNKHTDFFLKYAEALVGFILQVLGEHPTTKAVFDEGRGSAEMLGKRVAGWLVGVLKSHDTTETWRRQYIIGLEHIRRRIPNRHMMGLATRIREFVLPVMLQDLGPEEGLALYLAFQRFLDTIVALTATLVDEGQKRALMTSTGFSDKLIERLQEMVFEEIAVVFRPKKPSAQ